MAKLEIETGKTYLFEQVEENEKVNYYSGRVIEILENSVIAISRGDGKIFKFDNVTIVGDIIFISKARTLCKI